MATQEPNKTTQEPNKTADVQAPKQKGRKGRDPGLTTSEPAPKPDPERKPAKNDELVYAKSQVARGEDVNPNDVETPDDKRWTTASRARWPSNETADLLKEQAEIRQASQDDQEK